MKLYIALLTFFFLSINTTTAQESDVFRGMKWGDPMIDGLKDYEGLPSANSNFKAYRRINEDFSIGSVRASSIIYVYYKGRLSKVNFIFTSQTDYAKFIQAISLKYGTPQYAKNNNFTWDTPSTYIFTGAFSGDVNKYVYFFSTKYEAMGRQDDKLREIDETNSILDEL